MIRLRRHEACQCRFFIGYNLIALITLPEPQPQDCLNRNRLSSKGHIYRRNRCHGHPPCALHQAAVTKYNRNQTDRTGQACRTSIHVDSCASTKATTACCCSSESSLLLTSSYAFCAAASGVKEELCFSSLTEVVHSSSLCCICWCRSV